MNKNLLIKIVLSVAVCLVIGAIGAFATQASINDWYTTINKPFFNPPNWIFAPVWTILYTMMGIAAALVWHQGLAKEGVKSALIVFVVQFILNALWSTVFFGMRQPLYALFVIIALWIMLLLCIQKFMKINKTAGSLLVPYLLWISFATILNFSIYWLN